MPHLLLKEFEKGSEKFSYKEENYYSLYSEWLFYDYRAVQRIGFECAYCYEIYR